MGSAGEVLLLSSLLFASTGSELRPTRWCARKCCAWWISGSASASMACVSTRCRTCSSARAPTARISRRRMRFCASCAATSIAHFTNRMLLAEANQWPEDAVTYLARRERMPDGVSLPDHAAHVHVGADGGSFPAYRHLGANSAYRFRPANGRCSCAITMN